MKFQKLPDVTPDLSFTGLDEFVNKPVIENGKSDKEVSKVVRKVDDSLKLLKIGVPDSEEEKYDQVVIYDAPGTRQGICCLILPDYEEIDGGYVTFGGNPKGGKITGKGTIKTVELRGPRKTAMYSVDLKNIVPKGGLTCLFAKATSDESKLWHRRLGHLNFKTMNKLVKGNLVRGLPSKLFENDQTCVACQKGKQHRASYWLFDIDALTRIMNYEPIVAGTQSNGFAGTKASDNAGQARKEIEPVYRSQDSKHTNGKLKALPDEDGEEVEFIISKTTAWNEFSSTMASGIICLATNQKFNLLKFIFENMVRNMDNLSSKFVMYPRKPKRKDTQVPQSSDPTENVVDEVVHKELGDSLVRAATTASSLEAEQDSGNINKTQSKATPNESSSLGTTSGGGPRCQETMGDTIAQTRFESVSKHSNDSLLARGNTLRSDEDRLKLDELMALCTTLQNRVLDLEKTKTTQHNEIASLKRRVKKLEKKNRSRTHKLKRLYKVGLTARVESSDNEESLGEDASKQGRIDAIDADEEITLEVFVEEQEVAVKDVNNVVSTVSDATTINVATTTTATITTLGEFTTIISSQLSSQQSQDKAKLDKEERLAREKVEKEKEANIALIETWDDIHAKIDADHQLAERLQEQEQEELFVEENATLF
ncbi:ribonuclease H-like domain-containing protein [Tanacetum coccineum]